MVIMVIWWQMIMMIWLNEPRLQVAPKKLVWEQSQMYLNTRNAIIVIIIIIINVIIIITINVTVNIISNINCHHRHSTWSMLWLMSLVTIAWWVGVTKHYASTTGESFYFSHCTVNNEEGDNDDDRFLFKNSNLLDFTFSAALNWTAKNSFAILLHFSSVSFRPTTCKR